MKLRIQITFILIAFTALLIPQKAFAATVPHSIDLGATQASQITANGDLHRYRVNLKKDIVAPGTKTVATITYTKATDGRYYAPTATWTLTKGFTGHPNWGTDNDTTEPVAENDLYRTCLQFSEQCFLLY